jgi:U3 small nucleolar RNA-associated protein 23
VISQCSIRHLYADRENQGLIEQAKTYERRRCNHHTLEKPLSTLECFQSVVDPKDSKTNTHRYVVASQDAEVRAHMRRVAGVPLVYINRSVMIMEPMARATEDVREREEKSKFRAGLVSRQSRSMLGKRKRDQDGVARADSQPEEPPVQPDQTSVTKRSRKRGPKEPNPLSVRKPKSRDDSERRPQHASKDYERDDASTNGDTPSGKRKRRRKPSNKAEGGKLGDAEE